MSNSPFDFAKSITTTKVNLNDIHSLFEKEYIPFMVNRILSNSNKTLFFAEVMNMYPDLDKAAQYDFYLYGIPKNKYMSKMWTKKEDSEVNLTHINFIAENLQVSLSKALELYPLIGSDLVELQISAKGGANNDRKI